MFQDKNPNEWTFEEFKEFMEDVHNGAKKCVLDFIPSNSKSEDKIENKTLEEVLEITGSILLEDFISEHPC